jgi:CAAX prenyl protease-like protein
MMKSKPWLPYVVPMGIYMAFLLVQMLVNTNLLWLYPAKVVAVAVSLIYFRNAYEELRPGFSLLAVIVGLVVIVIWIGIDPFYPKFGSATVFDPMGIASVTQRNAFFAVRIFGAVIVVPVMEELFWRAFLIRWLVKEDFKSVPVGMFTGLSFAVTVGMFGMEHYQWLAGLICGALYNWLYYKRKDVFTCIIAHAVSNAALAVWVLSRGDWKFW